MGFRQDRVFVLMIYADLLNRQPDLATLVAIAQAMQGRAAAVLAGEGTSLSPLALRLDLTKSGGQPKIRESYEVVDGVVVTRYSEKRGPREAREASYAGAPIVYGAGFAGKTGGQGDAAASDAAALGLSYTVTLYGFPDEGSANAWLVDLPNRPRDEAGYLSWAHFPEAPPYGAASITYQFSRKAGGEATERGFRVYFQVGAVIASIDYATTGEPTLAEVEELVNAQIKCIEKGGCSGSAPIPGAAESGGRGDRQDGGQDGSGQDAGAEQG
jgi:hypothetical protein